MSCGCKKKTQSNTQTSNNVVVSENSSTNDTQQISLIDGDQIERLVKKIEQINNSSEKS
jgi:hypothetical protein